MGEVKLIITLMGVSVLFFSFGNNAGDSNNHSMLYAPQIISIAGANIDSGDLKEIKIGNQTWCTANLDVSNFRNGDVIPGVNRVEDWQKAGYAQQPAWCYYEYNPANGHKYGKLYNWFAVSDPRGLVPKGWHVPSNEEWTKLIDYLGGKSVAGAKMKSTTGWDFFEGINGNGTNVSGFTALPGGCFSNGTQNINTNAYWWSSSEIYGTDAWCRTLNYYYGNVDKEKYPKRYGLSVRCLKD